MDSKVCQENCDKKAAAAKKECGDDKACLENVMNKYKKCSAGCKVILQNHIESLKKLLNFYCHIFSEFFILQPSGKPSDCQTACDKKAAAAKQDCKKGDKKCYQKVEDMHKKCSMSCKKN